MDEIFQIVKIVVVINVLTVGGFVAGFFVGRMSRDNGGT